MKVQIIRTNVYFSEQEKVDYMLLIVSDLNEISQLLIEYGNCNLMAEIDNYKVNILLNN